MPSAAELYEPAPPEPGTEIPSATVNFGMRPYADNTFYVIAMKQGWFEDVGITIGPEELGLKVTDTNVIALLLNGQLDMSSQYCPLLLPTYKTSDKLKCVAFTDNFLGTAILANPDLGLCRTVPRSATTSSRAHARPPAAARRRSSRSPSRSRAPRCARR